MAKILIAGCGDVGIRLAKKLVAERHEVWGLRRDVSAMPDYIQPIAADLGNPSTLRTPSGIEYLFYMPSAGGRSEAAYHKVYVAGARNLLAVLRETGHPLRRVYYISSTGVYGQTNGEWVDENAPTDPLGFSGRRLLEGELTARGAGYPCSVVRFAGIYGPGRDRMIRRVRSGTSCVAEPAFYTNRIHSEDCAGMLQHLMNLSQPESLYLGVDHEPALQCEVMNWIAQQLGIAAPKAVSAPEADLNGLANKRCSNQRLLESGFQFRYPTFREGYAELLRTDGD